MAHAAAKVPAGRDMTEYSVGRSVASWISAIEILIHPEDDNIDYKKVYRHLDSVQWQDDDLKKNEYEAYPRKGAPQRSLPCWIYGELLRARNDFMHGNEIDTDRLKVESGRYLHHFAAPLYRMVLAGFLGLNWLEVLPEDAAAEAMGSYIARKMQFLDAQDDFERALTRIHTPPKR